MVTPDLLQPNVPVAHVLDGRGRLRSAGSSPQAQAQAQAQAWSAASSRRSAVYRKMVRSRLDRTTPNRTTGAYPGYAGAPAASRSPSASQPHAMS